MSDLIDRQKLLSSLHKFFKDGFIEDKWWNSIHVLAAIDELPSAQPESKTGRWILNGNGTWSCDKCHSWIPDEQHHYAEYCLFCGAKMDVEYDYDYERASDMRDYCERYEPTYNSEDGSM